MPPWGRIAPESGGRIEGLSPIQSAIVWRLLSAQGRIVTYEALFAAMYADSADGGPLALPAETVFTKLTSIKTRRPDLHARIHSVRGVGLRMDGPYCEAVREAPQPVPEYPSSARHREQRLRRQK